MRKAFIILLVTCAILQSAFSGNIKRFYSNRYCFYVDLPKGYSSFFKNNAPVFRSPFSTTYFHALDFMSFNEAYEHAKTLGMGSMIASKKEVSFAHVRLLRASRGAYIIFKSRDNKLTHIVILKKEHRMYIFKTLIDEDDLVKFRSFIKNIRLFLPNEKNYEGNLDNKIIRLTLFSDNTFRLNFFNTAASDIYIGYYKYKGSLIVLTSAYNILKSEAGIKKLKSIKVFKMEKAGDEGKNIKYLNVMLKLSTFGF